MNAATADQIQRIRDAFNVNRSKMTMLLARELQLPEAEVIRALPDGLSVELQVDQWEQIIRSFESLDLVHVISSNGSVTLECFGQFTNFSTWENFFNVQSKSLDMHIRFKELASVFAVQKPGHMDGVNTVSFQFFDRLGNSAFKVFLTFGGNPPSADRLQQFVQIRDRFRIHPAA